MDKLTRLIIPSKVALITYLSISLIFLIGARLADVLDALSGDQIGDIFNIRFDMFLDSINQLNISAPLALVLFWTIIGVIIYLVIVVSHNIWVEARNDLIVENNFVHPDHYQHSNFWITFVTRLLFRTSAIVLIFVLAFETINFLAPLWLELFGNWLGHISSPMNFLGALIAVTGASLNQHLFVIFTRLFFLRDRITNQ